MSRSASIAPEESIEGPVPPLTIKSRSSSKSGLMEMIPNIVSGLFGSPKTSARVGITTQNSVETIVSEATASPVPVTSEKVVTVPASVSPTTPRTLVTREKLDSWSFNVLDYSIEQLCEVMVMPFVVWNLLEDFRVPEHTFATFMREVSGVYLKNNFYHNFKHGCDVTHTTYRLIAIPRLNEVFSKLDLFCILVSAIAHDIGHLGVNNVYLINSKHQLALQYPVSPLENMHCARLFEILGKDDSNIFVNLSVDQLAEARKVILTSILGTDMINHGRQLTQTQTFLNEYGSEVKDYCTGVKSELNCLKDEGNRMFLLELVLHAADISNPYKPFELCERWAVMVVDEFCAQGDRERSEGLTVSPMCDRATMVLCNSQLGFIEFVMAPLIIAYVSLFPPLHEIVTNIQHNHQSWAERRKKELLAENKPEAEEECRKLDERIGKFAERMDFVRDFKDVYSTSAAAAAATITAGDGGEAPAAVAANTSSTAAAAPST